MSTGSGLDPEKYEEYKLFEKHAQLFRESLDRFEPKAFAVSSGPLDGFTDVFWRDQPLSALIAPVAVLLGYAIVFFFIARQLTRRWELA